MTLPARRRAGRAGGRRRAPWWTGVRRPGSGPAGTA